MVEGKASQVAQAESFLAVPATSARLFSKCGLQFGDLTSSLKEGNLADSIYASYNYDPSMYEGYVPD